MYERALSIGDAATARVRLRNTGNQPTNIAGIAVSDPQFSAAIVDGTCRSASP